MKEDKEYRFPISISKETFTDKIIASAMIKESSKENKAIRKQYGLSSIHYYRTEVNSEDLLNYLLDGHCVCHLYKSDKNFFYKNDKVSENFEGAYCVCVDIDKTKEKSVESYINKLPMKPTIYYTSYSHMKEGKGIRFRMIYVFNKLIKNHYIFRYFCKCLNDMIESSVEPIEDKCNLISSQYFNGTHRSANPEYGITNFIYDFADFDINGQDCINYLINYCEYKTPDKKHIKNIEDILYKLLQRRYVFNLPTMSFVQAPEKLSHVQVTESILTHKKCSRWLINLLKTKGFGSVAKRFKLFYRKESDKWIDNKYQYIDESFICLPFYKNRLRNGQKRRKKILERACLRRLIKPDVTVDELLVNSLWDVLNMFDNSDGVLTIDCLVYNVEKAMSMSIEEIMSTYGEHIDEIKKERTPQDSIILKRGIENPKTVRKEINHRNIIELYDVSKTDMENVEIIKERLGLKKLSVRLLKDIRKEFGITKYKKRKSAKSDLLNNESAESDYLVEKKGNNIPIIENESAESDYLVKKKKSDTYYISRETDYKKDMHYYLDWTKEIAMSNDAVPFLQEQMGENVNELKEDTLNESISVSYVNRESDTKDIKYKHLTLQDITADFFKR